MSYKNIIPDCECSFHYWILKKYSQKKLNDLVSRILKEPWCAVDRATVHKYLNSSMFCNFFSKNLASYMGFMMITHIELFYTNYYEHVTKDFKQWLGSRI